MRKLEVVMYLDPAMKKPFRIVETLITADGYRSRLSSQVFTTAAEAEAFIKQQPIHSPPQSPAE